VEIWLTTYHLGTWIDGEMALFELLYWSVEILEVERVACNSSKTGNRDQSLSNEGVEPGVVMRLTRSSSRFITESMFTIEHLSDSMEEDILCPGISSATPSEMAYKFMKS